MKNDILKTLALRAKNRMINKNLRDTYNGSSVKIIDNQDVKFMEKVKELVLNEQDLHNPISKLMDEKVLMNLDARARERYLFETIDKYQQARKKVLSEGIC